LTDGEDSMTPIRIRVAAIALSVAFGSVGYAGSTQGSAKRMADGKEWTTANLDVDTSPSYCYDDAELNCRRYGRLYTWESAQRACQSLGRDWRLPTDNEWRQLAKRYGGVSSDSADEGKSAFAALFSGGASGFNAALGGIRRAGEYSRVEAHGLYWTASENDAASAPFYNFGKGGGALHRQPQGEKQMAVSVRCVRE
jgi:uncharacterized protein (TIGR02145 family)